MKTTSLSFSPTRLYLIYQHTWAVPAITGMLLLFICYLVGALDFPTSEEELRVFNGALAMPVFITYGWISLKIMNIRAVGCLTRFSNTNEVTGLDFKNDIERRYRKNMVLACVLGASIGFSYLYSEDLIAFDLRPSLTLMNIYTFPFWYLICLLLLQLLFITRYVIKHFLDNEKMDLFGIQKLLPISDLVLTNTIISTFGLALIPLFWIGRTVPVIDKVILIFIFALLSSYLFWPVLKVQRIISRKKRLAISRINHSFQLLFDSKLGDSRRLTDNPERLRKLSSLISAKQEISAASEWPIDIPQSIKGILISLSIPLSWTAGSLIETVVSKLF